MDRRHGHPGLELGGDVVAVRARSAARTPAATRRRTAPGTSPSPACANRPRPSAGHPARSQPPEPAEVLAQRLAVHPRLAANSCCDRPAYQWIKISTTSITSKVLLATVAPPRCSATRRRLASTEDQTRHRHARPPRGNSVIAGWGNYVIVNPSHWRNNLIADTWPGRTGVPGRTRSGGLGQVGVVAPRPRVEASTSQRSARFFDRSAAPARTAFESRSGRADVPPSHDHPGPAGG